MAFLRAVFAKPKAIKRSGELLVAKIVVLLVTFELGFSAASFNLTLILGTLGESLFYCEGRN